MSTATQTFVATPHQARLLFELRRRYRERVAREVADAEIIENLSRHELAATMRRAANHDRGAADRVDMAAVDYVTTPPTDAGVVGTNTPQLSTGHGLDAIVSDHVEANRALQSALAEAADAGPWPERLAGWFRAQVVRLENRNARLLAALRRRSLSATRSRDALVNSTEGSAPLDLSAQAIAPPVFGLWVAVAAFVCMAVGGLVGASLAAWGLVDAPLDVAAMFGLLFGAISGVVLAGPVSGIPLARWQRRHDGDRVDQ